ncbi:MAG TPA: helix-turn-helix transcriptional regulator [Solirubrobacterales bacterium]|nr:helix-turn-helix transcriptional regulator [Solirubrobacterales bacterium]
MKFAENMLIQRRRSGLSQEELGFLTDLHRTEIGQLERGTRLPRFDTIAKLAGGPRVEPAVLFSGIEWQARGYKTGRFVVSEK